MPKTYIELWPDIQHNQRPRLYLVNLPDSRVEDEKTETALDFPRERRGIPWLGLACLFIGGGMAVVAILTVLVIVAPWLGRCYFQMSGC